MINIQKDKLNIFLIENQRMFQDYIVQDYHYLYDEVNIMILIEYNLIYIDTFHISIQNFYDEHIYHNDYQQLLLNKYIVIQLNQNLNDTYTDFHPKMKMV